MGAAGGGIWKTTKALAGNANWVNVSDGSPMGTNAIGALMYDPAHTTLYAGTGEPNASGDSEVGTGVFKSIDGGRTWTALGGNSNFVNRAISTIRVDNFNDPTGMTIYVASARGVHGISATTAGALSTPPSSPDVGVWKSTDGGATFTLLDPIFVNLGTQPGQQFNSSFGSSRGTTAFAVDPTHAGVVYASAFNVGIWRSTDNGATWTQIHTVSNTGAMRAEFAIATTTDGHTRIYSTEGDSGTPYSRLFVAEAVESGSPSFVQKTSSNIADNGYATYNFCNRPVLV